MVGQTPLGLNLTITDHTKAAGEILAVFLLPGPEHC
jgi:hypothetical protein